MSLTLARELLQKRGYTLDLRDIQKGERTTCRCYAVNGEYERFLCNFSGLAYLSTANFQYMIAQLPKASEAAS